VAAHDADDADRLATAGAGRAATQWEIDDASAVGFDLVEETFDQLPAAGLEIREEEFAALALDVENAAFGCQS